MRSYLSILVHNLKVAKPKSSQIRFSTDLTDLLEVKRFRDVLHHFLQDRRDHVDELDPRQAAIG
jgi:hypothetical protein